MHTHRRFLIALLLMTFPSAVQGQGPRLLAHRPGHRQVEYRLAQGEARELTGKYDYLVPAGEVRCLEADLRGCELKSPATRGLAQPGNFPSNFGRPAVGSA